MVGRMVDGEMAALSALAGLHQKLENVASIRACVRGQAWVLLWRSPKTMRAFRLHLPGPGKQLCWTLLWFPLLASAQTQKFASHFPFDSSNVPPSVKAIADG